MKSTFSGMKTLAALAAAAILAPTLQAATLTYAPGDLLLGVRKTGDPDSLIINLGPASAFANAVGTVNLSLGNVAADLDTAFGSGTWASDPIVFWSVSGTTGTSSTSGSGPVRTIYATRVEATTGTLATPWNTATSQGTVAGKMSTMGNFFASVVGVPNTSTANSPVTLAQQTSATNSYASYMPGGTATNSGPTPGTSFAYFNPTIEGKPNQTLDLFKMVQSAPTAGSYLGSFTLSSTGQVSFVSVTPVPEPGTLLILGLGGVSAALRRRRLRA